MFELILHKLKRVPRPLLPYLPIIGALFGPIAALLLIVYSVPSVHQEEVASWHWLARSNHGAVGSVSAAASQTRATNPPL
jgi:hypothetical protein